MFEQLVPSDSSPASGGAALIPLCRPATNAPWINLSARRPKHQAPIAAPCGKRTDGGTGRDSIRQVTAARGLWGCRWALTDLTYGSLEQTLIIPPVRDGYRRRFSEADKRHIVVATLYWQHVGRTRRKFFDVHDEEANSGPSLRLCKLNDVEPFTYLRDILQRVTEGLPMSRLDELLTWNWP
jgi:hypothetical protein